MHASYVSKDVHGFVNNNRSHVPAAHTNNGQHLIYRTSLDHDALLFCGHKIIVVVWVIDRLRPSLLHVRRKLISQTFYANQAASLVFYFYVDPL
jgi:hypothetical protein